MSIFSAHDILTSFGIELSPVLVAERSARSLRSLCAKIPYLGGAQYVECRLGNTPPAVDFLVALSRIQRGALGSRIDDLARLGPGFDGLARMLRTWADPGSRLHEAVAAIWLEFDDVDGSRSFAANVCPSIVPSYVDPFAPLASQAPPDLLATIYDCLSVIRGRACDEAEARMLRRCVWNLPLGAHWIHLSVMEHRAPPALKLYGVFPESALLSYLRQLEWGGDLDALQAALHKYCPARRTAGVLYVDLSVTELLRGRAGLGVCFSQQQVRGSIERDPRQIGLLASLVDDGLCTCDQAAALSAWPRRAPVSANGRYVIEQWLDLKLVQSASAALAAKAYLGFNVATRRPGLFGEHPHALPDDRRI